MTPKQEVQNELAETAAAAADYLEPAEIFTDATQDADIIYLERSFEATHTVETGEFKTGNGLIARLAIAESMDSGFRAMELDIMNPNSGMITEYVVGDDGKLEVYSLRHDNLVEHIPRVERVLLKEDDSVIEYVDGTHQGEVVAILNDGETDQKLTEESHDTAIAVLGAIKASIKEEEDLELAA